MASIAGLGKIGLPRLSENMDPEDDRNFTALTPILQLRNHNTGRKVIFNIG